MIFIYNYLHDYSDESQYRVGKYCRILYNLINDYTGDDIMAQNPQPKKNRKPSNVSGTTSSGKRRTVFSANRREVSRSAESIVPKSPKIRSKGTRPPLPDFSNKNKSSGDK